MIFNAILRLLSLQYLKICNKYTTSFNRYQLCPGISFSDTMHVGLPDLSWMTVCRHYSMVSFLQKKTVMKTAMNSFQMTN